MKKLLLSSLYLSMMMLISVHLSAQFDDLYYDASDASYSQDVEEDISYSEYDDASFDEYLAYKDNDYAVDAYRYTNRFNNYRFSSFSLGFNGGFNSFNDPFAYNRFNRYSVNRFGARSPWGGTNIFIGNSFGTFGRSNFGNPYSPFGYGFNGGGFGGGFASAAYCPPYSPQARVINNTVINNNVSARTAARTSSARTSSRVGSSVRGTSPRVSSARSGKVSPGKAASRSSRATSTRATSRTSSRATSRRTTTRATNSRSTYRPTSTRRATRSVSTPSRSVSRSSGATRSASPSRSGSSSKRGS